jgi:hypothetical protein
MNEQENSSMDECTDDYRQGFLVGMTLGVMVMAFMVCLAV